MCWAIVDGVAVAQESAEVTEELGSSYLLARRATGGGSIIETLLFDGRVIVTEIVWPGPDTGTAATGAGPIARTMAGGAAARGDLANLPPRVAPRAPAGRRSGSSPARHGRTGTNGSITSS